LGYYYLQKYLANLGPLLGLTLLAYLLRCNQTGASLGASFYLLLFARIGQNRALFGFF
jgi:hypothetical protein